MLKNLLSCLILAASTALLSADVLHAEEGWTELFDGQSLAGWNGNPEFWSVRDGAIIGRTTAENPTNGNTFLIYTGDNATGDNATGDNATGENADNTPAEFGNFELKADFRITGHNSGIQYRSFLLPDDKCPDGKNDGWRVGGYQADIDVENVHTGLNYGEKFRGILAPRGQRVSIIREAVVETPKGRRGKLITKVTENRDKAELAKGIKAAPEWNEYHIVADGWTLTQSINGVRMSQLFDFDEKNRRPSGLIAIQLHQGPPMTIELRNVRIKKLD